MAVSEAVAKRLSPFHHKQASLGAKFTVDDFGWARAEQYTDPASEKKAVEQGVGFADLSHLSKLGLNGPGLRKLVSERYSSAASDVRGRVLTGGRGVYENAWCAIFSIDEGMLVCHESLKEGILKELTAAETGHFTIVDVSSVFAACYLPGPNARPLLRRLTELNVNPEEFPNLCATHTPIRHVPTILLRNDLGPMLAYQLYFERAYAEYVWDAIVISGKELGLTPVGSSAMKLLGLR
jgi:heterotetrameric sarcosine oxidase gamma subunit